MVMATRAVRELWVVCVKIFTEKSRLILFKVLVDDFNGSLHCLDRTTGLSNDAEGSLKLHAHTVNGVFDIQKDESGKYVISFDGTKLTRFSMEMAFFSGGAWRLRYRLVVTMQDGILCFPLHTTFNNSAGIYSTPPEFDLNTVLIFGIATTAIESKIKVKIFANGTGFLSKQRFNGYFGAVKWNSDSDRVDISNNLNTNIPASNVYFTHTLYDVSCLDPFKWDY